MWELVGLDIAIIGFNYLGDCRIQTRNESVDLAYQVLCSSMQNTHMGVLQNNFAWEPPNRQSPANRDPIAVPQIPIAEQCWALLLEGTFARDRAIKMHETCVGNMQRLYS